MPIVYVQDSLASTWSGTGDKKLFGIISDGSYFMRDYSEEDFRGTYHAWFNNVRQRSEQAQVKSPNSTDKILLNIFTSQTVSASDAHDSETWDIEHICPKKVMKDRIGSYNSRAATEEERIGLPISSIGNVCYLPTSLNRTKEEKTIYQAGLTPENLAEIETKYTLTTEADMEWLLDPSLTAEDFKKKYLNFIQKRSDAMLELVVKFLFE